MRVEGSYVVEGRLGDVFMVFLVYGFLCLVVFEVSCWEWCLGGFGGELDWKLWWLG